MWRLPAILTSRSMWVFQEFSRTSCIAARKLLLFSNCFAIPLPWLSRCVLRIFFLSKRRHNIIVVSIKYLLDRLTRLWRLCYGRTDMGPCGRWRWPETGSIVRFLTSSGQTNSRGWLLISTYSIPSTPTDCFCSLQHQDLIVTPATGSELHAKPGPNENLKFGHTYSDHMSFADWNDVDGWSRPQITPLRDISIHPGAKVSLFLFLVVFPSFEFVGVCCSLLNCVRFALSI